MILPIKINETDFQVNMLFNKTTRDLILLNELVLIGTEPPDHGERTALTKKSHRELQKKVCFVQFI